MLCGDATLPIRASAQEVMELAMDLRRHREADDKVGPVWTRRRGNEQTALLAPCWAA